MRRTIDLQAVAVHHPWHIRCKSRCRHPQDHDLISNVRRVGGFSERGCVRISSARTLPRSGGDQRVSAVNPPLACETSSSTTRIRSRRGHKIDAVRDQRQARNDRERSNAIDCATGGYTPRPPASRSASGRHCHLLAEPGTPGGPDACMSRPVTISGRPPGMARRPS